MNEIISKAILSGLGFASLTQDAIRKTARDLVKRSKLSEEEGKRLVKDFQQRAAQAEKTLGKKVDTAVRKALKQFDLERIPHPGKRGNSAAAGKKTAKRPRRPAARTQADR
jgi:polyhydroxyalkanoate synthesis regulator phasin